MREDNSMREKQMPIILSKDTESKLIAMQINTTASGAKTQGPGKASIGCPTKTIPILVNG